MTKFVHSKVLPKGKQVTVLRVVWKSSTVVLVKTEWTKANRARKNHYFLSLLGFRSFLFNGCPAYTDQSYAMDVFVSLALIVGAIDSGLPFRAKSLFETLRAFSKQVFFVWKLVENKNFKCDFLKTLTETFFLLSWASRVCRLKTSLFFNLLLKESYVRKNDACMLILANLMLKKKRWINLERKEM